MRSFLAASKPHLIHSHSKQSITASDDYYYSLSSGESSNDGSATIRQYQTPPLHMSSPVASSDALRPDASISSIVLVKQSPPTIRPASSGAVRFAQESTTHEEKSPPASEAVSASKTLPDLDASPTTPGVDDTPYIRFAIDQLTRDEELLGSRIQRAPSEESYPVDRIISDEGLGYFGHDRQPSRDGKRSSDQDMNSPDPPCKCRCHEYKSAPPNRPHSRCITSPGPNK